MSLCADGIKSTSISSCMSCRTDRRIFFPLCRAWQTRLLDRLRASMISMQASAGALCAFAEIHDLLVKGDWHGADIRDLIRSQLAPFHNLGGSSVLIEGPELKLNPKAAEQSAWPCTNSGRTR